MTIEEIRKYNTDGGADKIKSVDELKSYIDRAAAVEKDLERAKLNGKADEYFRLTVEKERLAARIKQLRDFVASFPSYSTREEVVGGWNAYTSQYNAAFKKKYADYKKARKALAAQFMELYRMQRGALGDLRNVNFMVNENRTAASLGVLASGLDSVECMDIPSYSHKILYEGSGACPEAVFFIEAGEIDKTELPYINETILSRR